ncbi:autotransporter outer membrane beta-barrel domain-containing protein [Mesonia aquimarina]|uniref:autotransporter outer membrane beta-barrel domain-containing protein n=1 Tax=Mesonia aquimarina TaxID=1504967 RepID=UPI000EF5E8EF|nr:autotransporter outer membrane beta-barrel domain-containing protein [Mesonia aquimarina]
MKKTLFATFLSLIFAQQNFAQTTTEESTTTKTEVVSTTINDTDFPKNEVKLNIANTIAIASVEVGYERFFDFHQSVAVEFLINDRINYHTESGSRKFNTNSLKLGYNYYFGNETAGSGIYANPFLKYRFGDFEEEENNAKVETDMNAFMLGIGIGYKWNFNNKFVIGPYATVARNFSDEVKDRFTAIEFNAGLTVGYRF